MMSDIDIMFVRERMMEIVELRHAVKERERLIETEKAKTETASGLITEKNKEKDDIQKKLTAMCRCINSLAYSDWSKETPTKCKAFLVDVKKNVENCIREYDIHFNAEGSAE